MSQQRVGVTTRLPPAQKEQWAADAAELDMSQSEFVRTMVQAGRRELGLEGDEQIGNAGAPPARPAPEEPGSSDATPGGEPLEDRVLDILATEEAVSWDDLVARLTSDVEERLEDALDSLQAEGQVTHSGRRGGYVRHE